MRFHQLMSRLITPARPQLARADNVGEKDGYGCSAAHCAIPVPNKFRKLSKTFSHHKDKAPIMKGFSYNHHSSCALPGNGTCGTLQQKYIIGLKSGQFW
jgi:hypothetical protein